MARTWSGRNCGYKLAILGLFFASLLYLTGYAAPFWHYYDNPNGIYYSGLWMVCAPMAIDFFGGTQFKCAGISDSAGWFKAVQGFQSLGLVGMGICCIYSLVVNCCKNNSPHSRLLEIALGLTGLSGFIGCMVYVAMTEIPMRKYLGWAFGLNLTGCILFVVMAVIVFGTNSPSRNASNSAGVVVYSSPTAPVHMPGQGYPPQPGAMYVAQPGGQPGYAPMPQTVPAGPPTQGDPSAFPQKAGY